MFVAIVSLLTAIQQSVEEIQSRLESDQLAFTKESDGWVAVREKIPILSSLT